VLGAFPKYVSGLDINPDAVDYCRSHGMKVGLIPDNGSFPVADGSIDACVLDNVIEHIENPRQTLDECYRITSKNGGLVIVVPGGRGYKSDSDHKIFYSEQDLHKLDKRWLLVRLISIPFLFKSKFLSKNMRQYCLIAIYKKI
jgi:SAM-dependent methyltransferase